jgi:hypothetical protein
MEFMLFLWDELDDLAGACRHVATCAATEVAAMSAPLITALVAGTATFLGAYRHLLRFPG